MANNKQTQIPKSARIGIIGGGPSGVSAAYFLRKEGYKNVTMLESALNIAGKSATFQVDGREYDVGALMVGNNYHNVRELAEKLDCPLEKFVGRAHDIESNQVMHSDSDKICIYSKLLPNISHYLEERTSFETISRPGHGDLSSQELYAPLAQWLKSRQMEYMKDAWSLAFASAGYGFPTDDTPAAYFLKFVENSENSIRFFPNGFYTLWEKMAKGVNVICDAHVTAIDRSLRESRGITLVTYENRQTKCTQTLAFDELIVATNPKQTRGFLDVTPVEQELFQQVFCFDYYTVIASVDGLSTKAGLTTIPKHCGGDKDQQHIGHATAFYCAHEGVPTYTFYAYGNAEVSHEEVTKRVKEDIEKLGGTLKTIHYNKHWDFFPHVNSLAMARGFFNKAESLQGENGTYYTGGWLDFELTENCVAYSRDLVRRFFSDKPNDSLHASVSPPVPVKEPATVNWGTVLRVAAKRFPDKAAFTWVDSNLKEEAVYTYAELYRQARAVAHYLTNTAQHKAGDRVMLCYAPGLKFLPVLFGCLLCGVIAVPVAPPNLANAEKDMARFSYLAKTTGARLVFSDKNYVTYTMLYTAKSFVGLASKIVWPTGLNWVDTDAVTAGKQLYDEHLVERLDSDSVAVLQFSSGSTADPKGVMLTHKNTLHNVDLMQAETGINSDSAFAFWVPQFHDLGLIGGFLNTVRAGCRAIVMSPLAFLQKPECWLQMISRYGANFTAAPNFAYEYVTRKCSDQVVAELDMSSLKGAFNGAEPVRWSTLRGFAKKFQSTGFKIESFKCLYGLAEHCAYAVGFRNSTNATPTVLDIDPDALRIGVVKVRTNSSEPNNIVSTGVPSIDMQIEIRIVDPETKRLCPPNAVGEVWLSSPSVGKGYFGLEEVSDDTFRAKLQNSNHGEWNLDYGSFLRTGDLGFIHQNELFITGRQKDVIIINGRNHYPQDIELTVEGCHSLIRPGSICAIHHSDPATGTDSLIVLAEIQNTKSLSEEEAYGIGDAIAQAVPAAHGVPCARIVLLRSRTLPKTTSGKLQRSRAKDTLFSGGFDKKTLKNIGDVAKETSRTRSRPTSRIFQAAPPQKVLEIEEIERTIATSVCRVSKIAARLPVDALDVNASLIATYGFDSLAAVQLTSMLQKQLNVEIAPAILVEVPTISGLARHIAKQLPKNESRTTVSAQDGPPVAPLAEIETVIGNHVHKISKLAAKQPRDRINVKANLMTDYGFDSLAGVQLTAAVSQSFGIEVAAGVLYELHTIADLAAHVHTKLKEAQPEPTTQPRTGIVQPQVASETLSDDERPSIFALAPRNHRNRYNPTLYCVHPLLGNVASYVHFSQIIGMTRPVYGIASPKVFPTSVQALARRYVQALCEAQPAGPYHLCGYSYGGLIAWEMARALVARGEVVGGLYLIDAPAPLAQTVREPLGADEKPEDVWSEDIDRLMTDVDSQWMVRKEMMEPSELDELRRMVGGHIAAMYSYTMDISALTAAQPFVVHFWRAKDYARKTSRLLLDHPEFGKPNFGWERYCGTFVAHTPVPGHHYSVLLRDNCGRLAKDFDRAIPSEGRRFSSVELKPLMLADSLPPMSPTGRRESNASTIVSSPVGQEKDTDKLGVMNATVPLYLSLVMTSMVTYTAVQVTAWWYQCM